MNDILKGLRVVEGAAFVAAPLCGMTLAQQGADVIRFDPLGGGLDARRWPVTAQGRSLYWAGLNKGKRSLAVDTRGPEGRELIVALVTAAGDGNGIFLTNFPASGWLGYDALRQRRDDLIMMNVTGNPDGSSARRLHGQLRLRLSLRHRSRTRSRAGESGQPRAAGVGLPSPA